MLVWIDLEMTGLDPRRHTIVEIATLITDDNLAILEEGPDLVISATPEQLDAMDAIVKNMHTKSGLIEEIRLSAINMQSAADQTLRFIQKHVPNPRTVPLCGNSIGTDRRFLAEYMPEIENYLHYRSVDVSSIKELGKRWFPDVINNAPSKSRGHRAMDDIKESVVELQFYREHLFKQPGEIAKTTESGEAANSN
ncbi:MAG: oligoribonuclease [Actinomycetota bacterium]|nr:MAG: oligoribonuclease [Actinomycetota bacterium]